MDVLPQRITELTEKKTIVFFKIYFLVFTIVNLCPPIYLFFKKNSPQSR
jgi:hypothetical protein